MPKPGQHKGFVRVISGKWRSLRIPVVDVAGLRPTGDRVRETLFNWLQASIPGSRCLDIFAGTGALGIEAVSRSAVHALLLERHHVAVAALHKFLGRLDDPGVEVLQTEALFYLGNEPEERYDVVFIDPPFDMENQEDVMNLLAQNHWLSADALIYVESAMKRPPPTAPAGWQALKTKAIGDVRLQLFRAP